MTYTDGYQRVGVLLVVIMLVVGSLPLGVVGLAAAESGTGGDNISNPTDTLPDDQLFNGTEDGQVVVWERSFLPLRTNDTGAATQVPLPNNFQLQTLGDGEFTDGDDGTDSSQLVATFNGEDNPAGVHNPGEITVSYDASRISGLSSNIEGEDNVDFIAARLTGSGEGFPENYGDAVTNLFGSVEAANENATFETIQEGITLTDGTAEFTHDFDTPGQYVVYAVVNNDTRNGFEISNGEITEVDGTVALVGADMVSVQQGSASSTVPTGASAGENLSFTVDTTETYDQAREGQMTHVVAVYKKDTFEESRFDLVVDENALGPEFDLDNDSQIEHSIGNVEGVADVEDGITINGVELSNGRVSRSVGLGAVIDRLAEDLETTSPVTDPLSPAETLNASVVGVTDADRRTTVTVETTSAFENGTYQFIVLSKPAANASEISTRTSTLEIADAAEPTTPEITDLSVNDDRVARGETVTVTVTVENPTDSSITETLSLNDGETQLDTQDKTVPAGGTGVAQLSATFNTIGDRTLTVSGETVQPQTVSVSVVAPTEREFEVFPTDAEVDEQVTVEVRVTNNRRTEATIPIEFATGLPEGVDIKQNFTIAGESSDTFPFTFSYDTVGERDISLKRAGQTQTVDVSAKTVSLITSVSPRDVAPGENVSVTVRREDTNKEVDDVDVVFRNQTTTVREETNVTTPVRRSFNTPGDYEVTASKSDPNINFVNDTAAFEVLQPANISLTGASTPFDAVIASNNVEAQATLENTGKSQGPRRSGSSLTIRMKLLRTGLSTSRRGAHGRSGLSGRFNRLGRLCPRIVR